ncbi:MAG: hypothetical protein KHY47_13850 [Prevotella sp.]|nr:hypothetical protein [Prevotella sp.]
MANKHLTEDEIRYTVDVKTADAQKAIYTLEQQSKKLRSENKARLNQMISLEAAGRKETEAYRNLKKQYSDTSKEIRTLTDRIGEQTSKIDILDMSMVQLKKQQKSLQKELDNTVQSLNPEAYGVLEQRLKDVSGRISELKQNAKSFGELASDDTVNGVLLGNLLTKGAELFSDKVREFKDSIAELINGGLEMAEQADGVTDSIVTGLGRKSPLILDNLGISAAEISEKTKETGDFMKAVAEIVDTQHQDEYRRNQGCCRSAAGMERNLRYRNRTHETSAGGLPPAYR